LNDRTPDSILAPWLESTAPDAIWVVGQEVPPVVSDYQAHSMNQVQVMNPKAIQSAIQLPNAALIADPIQTPEDLLTLGQVRNLLIPEILCFVSESMESEALYALAFKRGEHCRQKRITLLSFHYSLATYNHARAWNNPKFWANPENWNKYWW
jgi:hypothetical protein